MKRFIFLLVMMANAVSGLFAQSEFFYSSNGEKEWFKIRKDKVILKPKSAIGAQRILLRRGINSAYGFGEGKVIATIDTLTIRKDTLLQNEDVSDVAYFLEYSDGTLQAPTDQIFVKPKGSQSLKMLFGKIDFSGNVVSTKLINPQHGIYLVTLNVKLGDVLSITRKLFETGSFEFVEPSFVRQLKPYNTHYSNQWGLKNTGQYGGTTGIDIKAEAAWTITQGNWTFEPYSLTPSYWAQFGEDNSQLTFYPVPGPGSYSFFVTMQAPGCTATKEFEFTETDGYTGYTGYSYSYSQQSSILTVDFGDRQQIATAKSEISKAKTKTTIPHTVKVFYFDGSLVEQGTSADKSISFSLAGKPNGIYFVNIYDVNSNRLIRSMKFLKEY